MTHGTLTGNAAAPMERADVVVWQKGLIGPVGKVCGSCGAVYGRIKHQCKERGWYDRAQ